MASVILTRFFDIKIKIHQPGYCTMINFLRWIMFSFTLPSCLLVHSKSTKSDNPRENNQKKRQFLILFLKDLTYHNKIGTGETWLVRQVDWRNKERKSKKIAQFKTNLKLFLEDPFHFVLVDLRCYN